MKPTLFLTMLCLFAPNAMSGEKTLDSIDRRFAGATEEQPSFQRHVMPLLGKLGCNGRACHGSFQGRGGFRLSLFGYDFKADHESLLDRLDTDDPNDSLMIHKPLMIEQHEGGRRFREGSWQHKMLVKWIQDGAKPAATKPTELVDVQVTPNEVLFRNDTDTAQLKVVAIWADGTREDVTPLCRFKTNDEQVADVTKNGLVKAGTPGDSHIVVSYDRAVVPVPVIRPVSDHFGDDYPIAASRTQVDSLVVNKLSKLGIIPSEVCTDSEFLRRVSLDLTGTLPTAKEVEAFLEDQSSEKRTNKVNELLERPGYTAWWTTKLCDFTGNSTQQLNNVTPVRNQATKDWYNWIYHRVENNTPYDELVQGLVVANSRNEGETFEEFSQSMSELYHEGGDPTKFAEREGMPHYWARRNFKKPEERAIGFAYTFMGTRIQCAQCHKHPFDQWTQDDFKQFQNIFTRTTFGPSRTPQDRAAYKDMLASLKTGEAKGNQLRQKLAGLLKEGKTVPFAEVYSTPPRPSRPALKPLIKPNFNRIKNPKLRKKAETDFAKRQKRREQQIKQAKRRNRGQVASTGKLLGGDVLELNKYDDPREPLMEWLRAEPKFAMAFVNRVWANYFNRGIVEPADDMSLANPPVNAELLDYLASGFVENQFDMKWLHREIANSDTYQRTWRANDTNRLDERNFSRAVPRRLPAEVAVDAIVQATSGDAKAAKYTTDNTGRAIALPSPVPARANRGPAYALTIFGQSTRESNCDCDRSMEPSLLQTVFLRNDDQTLALIDGPDSWLAQIAKDAGIKFTPKRYGGGRSNQANRRVKAQLARQVSLVKKLRKEGGKFKQIQKAQRQIRALRQRLGMKVEPNANAANADEAAGPEKGEADAQQHAELVRDAYLRTLSRVPTDDEKAIALAHLSDAPNVVSGARDLMWALLNTKEFIVNH